MQVQVKHGLPGVGVRVDDETISLFGYPFAPRQIGRDLRQFTDDRPIGDLIKRRHVRTRHDENVNGRLWIHVAKGNAIIRLGDDLGRDLFRDDSAE